MPPASIALLCHHSNTFLLNFFTKKHPLFKPCPLCQIQKTEEISPFYLSTFIMLFELLIVHQTLVQISPPTLLQPGSSSVCMGIGHCMHKYPADRSPVLPACPVLAMFLCWVGVTDEDLHYRAEWLEQRISARGGLGKPFLLVMPFGNSHGIHCNHQTQISASLLLAILLVLVKR